ncbi:hypothetical protein [Ancylobacter amanitiformis]|uniref:Membrane metal-binding protein n=1 Tax=Ancylobacter amanitiformis TaxID=217069 RepID=A0ABU0LU55_9HYPH|nr:hypothetical protein [Ancylobacter amanitiformis]MDQ0512219.1 putative membrane metal-binding protein [Ancylobacter amanitiformis]
MFNPVTWTGFHTWLSLIAIAAGLVVLLDLFAGRDRPLLTAIFLATAVATSATGFGFPFTGLLPSHIVGLVALAVLAVTLPARYHFHRAGHWNWIYLVGVVISLWLLVFVGIAQSFAKVPALQALAPTQSEPPFAIAQLAALALFVLAGVVAVRGSRAPVRPAF